MDKPETIDEFTDRLKGIKQKRTDDQKTFLQNVAPVVAIVRS